MGSEESGRVVRAGAALYTAGVVATHASGLSSRPVAAYVALLADEPLLLTSLWLAAIACLIAVGQPPVPDAGAFVFGLGPLLVESYLFYLTVPLPWSGGRVVHPAVGGAGSLAVLRFAAALLLVGGSLAALYRGSGEADRDSRVPTS
jgi:hypothetical protein